MILQTQTHKEEIEGALASAYYGISEANSAHIISILRDKLYSNKPLAVIREYSTNALDAHIEAGIFSRPIKVQAPTQLDPFLYIRDYGKGLSPSGIVDVYVQYGESTKRLSNNQVGQLGLGSKSAFAYTENFQITSYFEGRRYIYTAFVDNTNLGRIILLDSSETDEESGIEIKIPVQLKDIYNFQQIIKSLLRFFPVLPVCNIPIDPPKELLKGTNWQFITSKEGPQVVMGAIPYPLEINKIPELPTTLKALGSSYGLVIYAPIGDLNISASRESLEYIQGTRAALIRYLKIVDAELVAEIEKRLKDCTTGFQIRCTLKALSELAYLPEPMRQKIRNLTVWNQKPLLHSYRWSEMNKHLNDPTIKTGSLKGWRKTYRGTPTKIRFTVDNGWESIYFNPQMSIIIKDTETRWKQHLADTLLASSENQVFIWEPPEDTEDPVKLLNTILEGINLDGIPVKLLTSIDFTPPPLKPRSPSINPPREKTPIWKLDGLEWVAAEADLKNDTGKYILINRFKPLKDVAWQTNEALASLIAFHEQQETPLTIYGIKKAQAPNIGPNWTEVSVEDFAAPCKELLTGTEAAYFMYTVLEHPTHYTSPDNLNARFNKLKPLKSILASYSGDEALTRLAKELSDTSKFKSLLSKSQKLKSFRINKAFVASRNLLQTYLRFPTSVNHHQGIDYILDHKDEADIIVEEEALLIQKYPLLPLILGNYTHDSSKLWPAMLTYIQLLDEKYNGETDDDSSPNCEN